MSNIFTGLKSRRYEDVASYITSKKYEEALEIYNALKFEDVKNELDKDFGTDWKEKKEVPTTVVKKETKPAQNKEEKVVDDIQTTQAINPSFNILGQQLQPQKSPLETNYKAINATQKDFLRFDALRQMLGMNKRQNIDLIEKLIDMAYQTLTEQQKKEAEALMKKEQKKRGW